MPLPIPPANNIILPLELSSNANNNIKMHHYITQSSNFEGTCNNALLTNVTSDANTHNKVTTISAKTLRAMQQRETTIPNTVPETTDTSSRVNTFLAPP